MKHLATVERIILESIGSNEKTIIDIYKDTGIAIKCLGNALLQLNTKHLISSTKVGFKLSSSAVSLLRNNYNQRKSIKGEVQEIMNYSSSLSIEKKVGKVALKKVYLGRKDKILIKAHLAKLESMLKDIQSRNEDHHLKDKTVLFWGFNQYHDLVKYMSGWA